MLYIANSWAGQWSDRYLEWLSEVFNGVGGNWLEGPFHKSFVEDEVTHLIYAPTIGEDPFEPTAGQMAACPSIAWVLYPDAILEWDPYRHTYGDRIARSTAIRLARADAVVANSGFTARLLESAGINDVRICHLGVDVQGIAATPPSVAKGKRRRTRVMWNHQWRWQKNIVGAFDIMLQLAREYPDVDFFLCRKEDWSLSDTKLDFIQGCYREFRANLRRAKVENIYLIPKFPRQTEYWAFLRSADVAFSCSFEETFGIGMVEAAAAGAACVAPNRFAYPEVLPHALLVGDAMGEVMNAIRYLLSDCVALQELSSQCNEDARLLDLSQTCMKLAGIFGLPVRS